MFLYVYINIDCVADKHYSFSSLYNDKHLLKVKQVSITSRVILPEYLKKFKTALTI